MSRLADTGAQFSQRLSDVGPWFSQTRWGKTHFAQALKFRIEEARRMGVLLFSIVPRTIGLFLLGARVWRWNLLHGDRGVLAAIAIVGIALGAYATRIRASWAFIG